MEWLWPVIALIAVGAAGVLSLSVVHQRRSTSDATPFTLLNQQVESLREQVRANLEGQSTQLSQQLQLVQQQVASLLEQQSKSLQSSSAIMHDRLNNAAKVIGEMHRELGKVATTVQAGPPPPHTL